MESFLGLMRTDASRLQEAARDPCFQALFTVRFYVSAARDARDSSVADAALLFRLSLSRITHTVGRGQLFSVEHRPGASLARSRHL